MKALKIIGIIVALIIVLLVIAITVLPTKAHVERSVVINAPAKVVYSQLINMRKFNDWSPWADIDPNANFSYEGPNSGIGAKRIWESNHKDVGVGSQWIVATEPNKFVKTEMIFGDFQDTSFAAFELEEDANGTKVTWTFESELSPPLNLFGPMMDGQLGPYYEKGLQNLKVFAESLPTYSIDIMEENVGPIYYLGIKSEMQVQNPSQIKEQMTTSYGALVTYMTSIGKQGSAMPICLYFDVKEDNVVMEPAIPVDELMAVNDDKIEAGEIPAVKVLKGIHYGDYEKLGQSHEEITKYVRENNLIFDGHIWEQYMNDPFNEPDTTKWITHIYYAIK